VLTSCSMPRYCGRVMGLCRSAHLGILLCLELGAADSQRYRLPTADDACLPHATASRSGHQSAKITVITHVWCNIKRPPSHKQRSSYRTGTFLAASPSFSAFDSAPNGTPCPASACRTPGADLTSKDSRARAVQLPKPQAVSQSS
jgi:hypothetical protein